MSQLENASFVTALSPNAQLFWDGGSINLVISNLDGSGRTGEERREIIKKIYFDGMFLSLIDSSSHRKFITFTIEGPTG